VLLVAAERDLLADVLHVLRLRQLLVPVPQRPLQRQHQLDAVQLVQLPQQRGCSVPGGPAMHAWRNLRLATACYLLRRGRALCRAAAHLWKLCASTLATRSGESDLARERLPWAWPLA
jgi:hypothetical protein